VTKERILLKDVVPCTFDVVGDFVLSLKTLHQPSSHKRNWTHFNFYKVPSSLTSSEYGGRLEDEIEEIDVVDEEPLIVDILSVEFEEL